ncbi:hypothetical protein MC885_021331 [Smutsia gigantea]|nr:hypothetical protein MC885_021331 [Smutsia gigantea]
MAHPLSGLGLTPQLVMEDIFISGDPLLESVGLHEPLVEELRGKVANAVRQAVVPLQAYAREYRKYLELNNNDVTTFLKAYQMQCPLAEEVRGVVLTHLQEKDVLDSSLPGSIIIGPFYINIDNVKQSLSKKCKALATSMLDILAKNLHKEVHDVRALPPCPSDCSDTPTLTYVGQVSPDRSRAVCRCPAQWKDLEVTVT